MSAVLSVGEIAKGMKITVLSWKPREVSKFGLYGMSNISVIDTSFCGDVCEVMAIDLPYIVIRRLGESLAMFAKPTKIDTRDCTLKELSKDYVDAMLSQKEGEL